MSSTCKKTKRSLGSLFKSNDAVHCDLPTQISPEQKIKCEINSYVSAQKLDTQENPLHWWKSHGKSAYPLMATVSKKYLCAPATSTSSEQAFSKGGRIVTPFRASLKPDTVEMLIFFCPLIFKFVIYLIIMNINCHNLSVLNSSTIFSNIGVF